MQKSTRMLCNAQVVRRIHHARNQHYSGNVHGSLEIPPLSLALDDVVSFFQLHFITVNHDDLTKPTRILGWAHPALVALLRYHGTTIFVDGTFRCVHGERSCISTWLNERTAKQFPNAIVIDYLFHMKYALRGAMKRCAIPEEECHITMTCGVLDTLTVVEHEQIKRGIKWLEHEVKQRCALPDIPHSNEKWGNFWSYFERTWLDCTPSTRGMYTVLTTS
ncbi:hypothetical protein PHMEG_0002776 [Phytophthora megakarya]|uniref:MULE transposase domain-containing protein n=1 Tax=Phytophthora megakarya TaxID=4795 RepID=A0A225WZS8_9STRA|nr:hypothetical protein PHMEG_0002776 [Phytophthora megakarya]